MQKLDLALIMMLGAAAFGSTPAEAKASKASFQCRSAVGSGVKAMTAAGLHQIDACNKARDKGKGSGDCNALAAGNSSSAFGRAAIRAGQIISARCKPGDPVIANYPGNDIPAVLFPAVESILERSADELQGAPVFTGDKQAVKALAKCHGAIGKGRTQVVTSIVTSATKCQKKIDKKATTFGPISPQCVAGSSAAGGASAKIAKACGSVSGVSVGSCGALPGCVVDAATTQGEALARITYGGPTECGNGIQEIGEACDDGNTDPGDDCTDKCTLPTCGDGVKSAGEECDGGAAGEIDGTCIKCKLPVCGDGVKGATEECDDGNATPNDGCTDCVLDPLFCGGDGVIATIAVPYDRPRIGDIAALGMQIGYPAFTSLPGSGLVDSSRLTDAPPTGLYILKDLDLNADGTDDTLDITYASTDLVPPGDFARVRFDCTLGSPIRPSDFACTVYDATDHLGSPFPVEDIPCSVGALALPGGPSPTTTTSSTSTTSSTTTSTAIGTTTTSTSTSSTTSSTVACTNVCGNNTVEACETCDDGNTSNEDTCPSDCRVDDCTPLVGTGPVASVTFTPPVGISVAGITVFVDYPEGKVSLPGSGSSASGAITNTPPSAFATPNDFDHAMREVIASGSAITPGLLFRMNFQACAGAPAPVAGDFTCTVTDASDPLGTTLSGVTCAVTVP